MPIPLYDVRRETLWYAADLRAAFDRALAAGRFSGGDELAAFESELANYCGSAHAIGVKSGTDAIVLALKALGIGPGHEVITSAFTFFATAEAIVETGAAPVFCDVDPVTLCLTAETIKSAITSRTKAVLLVHVFGHCADLDAVTGVCSRHAIPLVEDAAQSIGATWRGRMLGSIGVAGTLSFYPTKNLSALGNGGAILTSDEELASAVHSLQNHGRDEQGRYSRIGCNSHLDELQAAFLRVKLAHLESELALRRAIAARYDAELPAELARVRGADGCVSNYHQYGVRTARRDALRSHLAAAGIGTGDYYSTPLYDEPALAPYRPTAPLPVTEQACRETLTLPVRPSLSEKEQAAVTAAVCDYFGRP
jgi:dTDP-3-amino-3,4,6-trideoxy-alpha-D-glucose transaminase